VFQARVFASLIFFAIGGFAVIVGAHDAFSSIEVASRFGGLLLLFSGLSLTAVAIFLLVKVFPWAPTAGVLISPLGAIVGLSFISAQLLSVDRDWWPIAASILVAGAVLVAGIGFHRGPWGLTVLAVAGLAFTYGFFLSGDHDERLVFWVAIVFASGLACFALWRAQRPKVSISATRVVGGLFGFFTLSALIGGAQLWYTSQYLPASLGASLSVESQLTRLGTRGNAEVAKLTLSIENTAQTQAKVLGSLYRVTAAPVHPIRLGDRQIEADLDLPQSRNRTVSRFRRSYRWDVVQAGRIFADGSWLDPAERFSTSTLVYLPRGKYDTLRSSADVVIAKGKALTLGQPGKPDRGESVSGDPVHEVVSVWPIEETSWFRQLTHAERKLELEWITGIDGNSQAARFPFIGITAHRVDSDNDINDLIPYNEQLFSTYGMGDARSRAELALGSYAAR
jgi:hypothetical protein